MNEQGHDISPGTEAEQTAMSLECSFTYTLGTRQGGKNQALAFISYSHSSG